jgi:hypothetical protein
MNKFKYYLGRVCDSKSSLNFESNSSKQSCSKVSHEVDKTSCKIFPSICEYFPFAKQTNPTVEL